MKQLKVNGNNYLTTTFVLSADVAKKIMKLFDNIIVIDDFLTPEEFLITKTEADSLPYERIPFGVDPSYKLNTGEIYKTEKKYWSDEPTHFKVFFDKLAKANLVQCTKFSLMVHVYRAGAEIDWHQDYQSLSSYSFYLHDRWESTWGGNLLVADSSTTDDRKTNGSIFTQADMVLDPGYGNYYSPKPNRLVIIGKVFHKVERVDQAAGNNCRKSLTGFYR
jgi:hypothetical protein